MCFFKHTGLLMYGEKKSHHQIGMGKWSYLNCIYNVHKNSNKNVYQNNVIEHSFHSEFRG